MTKIFISTFLLLASTIFSQTKGRLRNKTLKDSVFSKGDIIKIPEIIYGMSNTWYPTMPDSVKPIADFLNKHKNLVVELGCHTDTRGKAEFAAKLSVHRVLSPYDYLVRELKVDTNQLKYKGYGSSRPIILDAEIKKAKTQAEKEKLHQKNQRTELKVISDGKNSRTAIDGEFPGGHFQNKEYKENDASKPK
jgi:hypothetical protein